MSRPVVRTTASPTRSITNGSKSGLPVVFIVMFAESTLHFAPAIAVDPRADRHMVLHIQRRLEDAAHADEVFSMLMGEDVAPRKRFIQTRAKSANLDI